MSKRDHLQSLARKVTGNNNLHCGTVKEALHCIAEKAAGESVKCTSICSALDTIEKNYENLIGGDRTAEAITITENGVTNTPTGKFYDPITVNVPSGDLKYHLYAWDYAGGEVIAYSEKELPQAGDVVFLKEDMEGGKITDPTELKLIYHVVSDADGVITVSEHPEGQAGGYVFNRNNADDYEETVTDVRDMVDVTENGFLMSQKGTVFKGANVNVSGGGAEFTFSGTHKEDVPILDTQHSDVEEVFVYSDSTFNEKVSNFVSGQYYYLIFKGGNNDWAALNVPFKYIGA